MNIGELKLNGSSVYMGKIQTAALDLVVGLRPVNSSNDAAPKYDVMVRAKNGQFIPVGGLWEKAAANGSGCFLQGQIDDPSFEAPLSVALFTQEDGALTVAWSRPRRRTEAAFGGAAATGSANDGFTDRSGGYDDASPFGNVEAGLAKAA